MLDITKILKRMVVEDQTRMSLPSLSSNTHYLGIFSIKTTGSTVSVSFGDYPHILVARLVQEGLLAGKFRLHFSLEKYVVDAWGDHLVKIIKKHVPNASILWHKAEEPYDAALTCRAEVDEKAIPESIMLGYVIMAAAPSLSTFTYDRESISMSYNLHEYEIVLTGLPGQKVFRVYASFFPKSVQDILKARRFKLVIYDGQATLSLSGDG